MDSAVLLFLFAFKATAATSMGVMYGWQPMPGDSQKVEYIVQVEPELAARMKAGQSIPITSDVPDDIGPIGRIRIVVGREELPRQKLVTDFKPWPAKTAAQQKPHDGIVETQYTVEPVQPSAAGRYGAQPASSNEILPPSSSRAATSDPFGRALQQGAQQARNATNGTQQILPPADQLFGSGGNNSQYVRTAIDNTTNQWRQGAQRSVEQVADRTGQQLRQAVDNVEQGARQAVDKFGRSLTQERSLLSNTTSQPAGTILPPQGQSSNTAKSQRIDQPVQQPLLPRSTPQPSIASTIESRGNSVSRTGANDQLLPPASSQQPGSTARSQPVATNVGTQPAGRYGEQATQTPAWPGRQGQQSQPSQQQGQQGRLNEASTTAPNYASGNQAGYNPFQGKSDNTSFAAGTTQVPASQAAPEIRRNMLNTQTSNGLPAVNNTPVYQADASIQPSPVSQSAMGAYPNLALRQNVQPTNSQEGSRFPLLFSWVLLLGSVTGNLYLFWSYVDVRSKYRGVVHGMPGRGMRYDD